MIINPINTVAKTISKPINNDSDLRKIYTEEKDNFDKAYPNAQREHLDYFINQKIIIVVNGVDWKNLLQKRMLLEILIQQKTA